MDLKRIAQLIKDHKPFLRFLIGLLVSYQIKDRGVLFSSLVSLGVYHFSDMLLDKLVEEMSMEESIPGWKSMQFTDHWSQWVHGQ